MPQWQRVWLFVLLAGLAPAGCRAPAGGGASPLAWPANCLAMPLVPFTRGGSRLDPLARDPYQVRRLPEVVEPLAPALSQNVQLVGYEEEENRLTFAFDETDDETAPAPLAEAPAGAEPIAWPPAADSPLALADLELIALASNPAVGQAWAELEAARGNWVQVGLPPNAEVGYDGQQITPGGQNDQQGVMIRQEFITGGKLRLNREVAAQEVSRMEQVWAAQRERVVTDVRAGFYEVLVAQERVLLAKQLGEISAEAVRVSEQLFQAAEATQISVLQAQVEARSAEILIQNAANEYDAASARLATVVGQPDLPRSRLLGDLKTTPPPIDWERALARLLQESPELSAAMSAVERARWAAQRARAEVVPNVNVEGSVVDARDLNTTMGTLQASVPIPLLNRNQGGIRQADALLLAAEMAVERLRLSLERRLASVYQQYASARFQVNQYADHILPNTRETLQLTTASYQAGEIDFLTVLTAQRTYFQTHLAHLDALQAMWQARIEIEGLLLRDSLDDRP